MAQVTKDFILNKIEELDYPFFCIYDADGKTRLYHNYQDETPTSSEARGKLIEAFENMSGNVTVELKKQIKAGGDVRQMVTYRCNVAPNNFNGSTIKPVNGIMGTDIERLLQLQAENHKLQIEHLQAQHKRDIEMMDLKRQIEAVKNGDFFERHGDKIIGALPYILNGLTGKPNMPVAGPIVNGPAHPDNNTHDVHEATETVATDLTPEQQQLESLLMRWHAVDPEFLINLEKLVILAETKPEMYKLGLNTINNL